MIYMRVEWKHSIPDCPRLLYSEIDEERMECRKIDIYPDRCWGFADEHEEIGGSGLGEAPTPPLKQLASDPEFDAAEIERDEFERLWAARKMAPIMTPFPTVEGKGGRVS